MDNRDFLGLLTKIGKKPNLGAPALICLGGSRAIGMENKNSDWDFNVFFEDFSGMWESCIDSCGFLSIGGEKIHWYCHSMNSFLSIERDRNVSCSLFWSKLPLMGKECFLPLGAAGHKYLRFLEEKRDVISFCSLSSLMRIGAINDGKNPYYIACRLREKLSGLLKVGNHFGLSDFSRDDMDLCKTDFDLFFSSNRDEVVAFLDRLKAEANNFSLSNVDCWEGINKELMQKCFL